MRRDDFPSILKRDRHNVFRPRYACRAALFNEVAWVVNRKGVCTPSSSIATSIDSAAFQGDASPLLRLPIKYRELLAARQRYLALEHRAVGHENLSLSALCSSEGFSQGAYRLCTAA